MCKVRKRIKLLSALLAFAMHVMLLCISFSACSRICDDDLTDYIPTQDIITADSIESFNHKLDSYSRASELCAPFWPLEKNLLEDEGYAIYHVQFHHWKTGKNIMDKGREKLRIEWKNVEENGLTFFLIIDYYPDGHGISSDVRVETGHNSETYSMGISETLWFKFSIPYDVANRDCLIDRFLLYGQTLCTDEQNDKSS